MSGIVREVTIGDCRLIQGDCLDVLPVECNAVITDPPYAIPAAHYIGKRGEDTPRRNLSELSVVEHWFRGVAAHFPSDVPVYVFCDGQSFPIFYRSCYNRWKRIRPLVWDKMVSFNGYTWRHQHELIAWCESADCERVPTGDGDILRYRAVPVNDRKHPAEKPVELIERLVAKTTGKILDPFMGSGSTGEACVKAQRQFVGIEMDEAYFDIAVDRITRAYAHSEAFTST